MQNERQETWCGKYRVTAAWNIYLNVKCLKKCQHKKENPSSRHDVFNLFSLLGQVSYFSSLISSINHSPIFFLYITPYSAVIIAARLELVPAALGEGRGGALGRLGSSLGHVETNNHTQICPHITLMCMCINIRLMCICLTTQNEHGKWTRDLLATPPTATPLSLPASLTLRSLMCWGSSRVQEISSFIPN